MQPPRTTASLVLVLVLAVASTVVGPFPGAAQTSDETAKQEPIQGVASQPTEAATEEVMGEAEVAALAQARTVVVSRMRESALAEGDRRRAEDAVVAAHRAVRVARADLEHVNVTLDAALADLDVARKAQQAAQEHFDLGVATTYKFSGAQSSALLLAALQSAADAHDLARAVEELDGILGHSYDQLERRIRATAGVQLRVDALTRLRGVAYLVLQNAVADIRPHVEHLDHVRAMARSREGALLDAAAHALDAEQAALDAGADPAAVAASGAGDPLAPGSAAVSSDTGPDVGQRRRWLASRRRVLDAQAGLSSDAWTVRDDLACPVPGGTFGNDFHFPRSHGRRHLGTDIFAPSGTPIVALAAGEVTKVDPTDGFNGDSDLGGVTVSWTSEVGRFYAAHLLRVREGLTVGDWVEAGDVVGYVGATGNARGGAPHLHLGWYADGVEINPWPTLAVVCNPDGTR